MSSYLVAHPDGTLPTSTVRLGLNALGEDADIVWITSGTDRIPFQATIVDDTGFSDQNLNGLYHNHKIKSLFDTFENSVEVEPGSIGQISTCDVVNLDVHEGTREEVAELLSKPGLVLHRGLQEEFPSEWTPPGMGRLVFSVYGFDNGASTAVARTTGSTTVEDPVNATQQTSASKDGNSRNRGGHGGAATTADGEDELEYLDDRTPEQSFDDIVGVEAGPKTALRIARVLHPEFRDNFETQIGTLRSGSALLLYGPPGCGKTLSAEAIAYDLKNRCLECNEYGCDRHDETIEDIYGPVRFLDVRSPKISDRYVGEAPEKLETVFQRAYELADDGFVVLFFDEIDSIVRDRADADRTDIVELTNTFLREMQGQKIEDKNILVIAATNYPYEIDGAALDRFTTEMLVEPPDSPGELADIWRLETEEQSNADELDYTRLGEASVGFAPRELVALREMFIGQEYLGDPTLDPNDPRPIETDDYLELLEETSPSTIPRYLNSLSGNLHKLQGFDELVDFYETWSEHFSEAADSKADTA